MQLRKRQIVLLQMLKDQKTAEAAKISRMLDISLQTFKTELKTLEPMLESYGIEVVWLPGSRLEVNGRQHLTKMLKDTQANREFTDEDQILLMLALTPAFLTTQEIADRLYMSKSYTVKVVQKLLETRSDVESLRHYGIRYSGDTVSRRQIFAELLMPYLYGINFEAEIRQFSDLHYPLMHFISEESLDNAAAVISMLQTDKELSFTDVSVKQLFLQLLYILNEREGSQQDVDAITKTFVENYDKDKLYRGILENVIDELGLSLTEADRYYLTGLMMSLKKTKALGHTEIHGEMKAFIDSIIEEIAQRFDFNFDDDDMLKEGLSLHIYTTAVLSNMNEVYADEEQCREIRKQYPLGFEMAVLAAEQIEKEYGHHLGNNETVYLAMHFQAALERRKKNRRRIRVLLICHVGFAAANLIATKLERKFPSLEFCHTYSLQEYLLQSDTDCDLIITTEKIPASDKPVIYVSPGLTENELGEVQKFVDRRQVDDMLLMVLHESEIIDLSDCACAEQAINKMGGWIEKSGHAAPGYTQAMQDREKLSSTALTYIAVPHGDPVLVKETKLLIGLNPNGIAWGDETIYTAFLYAFNAQVCKENSDVFTTLYRRLASSEIENEIYQISSLDAESFKRKLIQLLKEQ